MARSGRDPLERMEFGWSRFSEQPIPRLGPYSHHAGEAGFDVTKVDRANERSEVRAERSHDGAVVRTRIYRHDEEDRGARERSRHGLWNRSRFNRGFRSGHRNRNSIVRNNVRWPATSQVRRMQ